MQTVVDALSSPYPCGCDCFHYAHRRRAHPRASRRSIASTTRCAAGAISRSTSSPPTCSIARRKPKPIRSIAASRMRDDACVYRRLVGFAVHELIHALEGDPTKANYGIPWGAPYNVPVDLPEGDEAAFLHPLQRRRGARLRRRCRPSPTRSSASTGASTPRATSAPTASPAATRSSRRRAASARCRTGIASTTRASITRVRAHSRRPSAATSPTRNYATTPPLRRRRGARSQSAQGPFPPPDKLARITPRLPGRNDACICGSGEKFKKCCGANL